MNLIIHDLDPDKWAEISSGYPGWNVVTDNGAMHPCTGCFLCWTRNQGKCAIHDGYENMGSLIHEAEEVVVISRYTYGGFSGSVKNVFDRCLGYVLPEFEVTGRETHHMKRYDEDKPFTFIFYGPALSSEEKASAERYVQAVCTNIRGHVKAVEFRVCESEPESREVPPEKEDNTVRTPYRLGRTVILNGSMRNISGNSAKLARSLSGKLRGRPQIIDLRDHMQDMSMLAGELAGVSRMILCVPLYVDGLPSQVIRLMEMIESYRGEAKQIYVLANMGLYESSQLVNLFSAVKQWCGKCGYEYCGGLGISAGELLGTLMEMIPFGLGATRRAAEGMDKLADAINSGSAAGDIYAEPYRFPRSLYIWIANTSWKKTKASGSKTGERGTEMSRIVNEAKVKNPLIVGIREQLEHRALWMYLLCDEAEKHGLRAEDFAPDAIRRCGQYQGKNLVEKGGKGKSLKGLKKALFGFFAQKVFEMDIIRCDDDHLDIDFHYCPLVKAWQKQGCSDEQIAVMCDHAMCGDRGIGECFGVELDLPGTIAKGDPTCQLRYVRR